jgi:hypothetical protein
MTLRHSMRPLLGAFMVKTGELKTAPSSWQDVFFPLLASLNGS